MKLGMTQCRSTIKEELIPRAVAWYTGAAVQGDDDDEEDDEFEEGDEDDGDDEESDDEVRACSRCTPPAPRACRIRVACCQSPQCHLLQSLP